MLTDEGSVLNGSHTAAVLEDRLEAGVYGKRGLTLVRGAGAHLWDIDGNEYIDCIAGHGVVAVGHANPYVVDAVTSQVSRLITCPETFYNDMRALYLGELSTVLPSELGRFFLCNSGTEAVEAALKFARLSTGRPGIVATKRGFHGRTMGALSVTWSPQYREAFEPLVPGVQHVTYGSYEAMEEAVDEHTAAVILEVVQGEGGVYPGDDDYFRQVSALCVERGALLIVDEVQTGFGRTGRWFGFEHVGIVPDMVCLAKAIAGGLPMGAVALGPRVQNLFPLAHGSTFGGSPLICAAALATLRYMKDHDLPGRAAELGAWFMERLGSIDSPAIREVRGRGLLVGVDLRVRATPVLKGMQDAGVLALPAGRTVVRFLPPLVIERDDLERVAQTLERVLGGQ